MIDELSAKVFEAKALIPKIEEAAKNEHLPAEDKPKAEQLVSNLEAFVKDVETQVSEKQDELDKLNNANDAIKRLGDALDDAEKTAVPSNVTALNEFKDRIAPHIATLVEAVQQVPDSVEPSAAALRDRAAKFVSDLEKNIEKTGDDEKRAEQLKSDVGNAVSNVDDVVSKYHNQTQPLDVAKEDANKLKTAVEQLTKLAESSDKIDPQVAKDIKDSKTKAKELLQALEKAIPQEDVIRREQAEIHDRLNNLEKELAKVDEFKPEDALPVVDQLASDTTTLKAVTDSNNEKAAAPSSLISHDDLVVGLPEKVFQLQHAIDDKKQALNKAAAVNEIAPKLQLVSQQLQSVPQDIPASLDEQKQLLEDVENQKHNLENLLANLPDNDPAADELRQKSQWDLSRLKDLLKQLGSAVGDKLAALAAFNAARKNAEDALLDITCEDGSDDNKSPDELIDDLTKKEETVAKLRETVAGVKPDELDEKERAEYNDLLARLANAADVLKVTPLFSIFDNYNGLNSHNHSNPIVNLNKRAELEQALKAKAEEKSLHDAVDRIVSRLVPLVRDAEELRHNAEAVPTQYAPKAEELKKEVEAAKTIIVNAPTSDAHVQQLLQAVANAETLIPDLEERASIWERFVKSKDDLYDDLEKLENTVSDVLNRPRLAVSQAQQRLNKLKVCVQLSVIVDYLYFQEQIFLLDRIRNSKVDFDDQGEALLPLTVVDDELRFMHVHVESIERQYEDTMDKLNSEITAEIELLRTLDILSNELSQCKEDINNPTADVDELVCLSFPPFIHKNVFQSRATMLNDAIAHLENQKVVVARSEKDRKFVESSTSTDLEQLLAEAKRLLKEIEPRLDVSQPDHDNEDEDEDEEKGSEEKPYDVRAAAEVLSALYPDEHPNNVLRNIGFEDVPSDSESRSEFDSLDSRSDGLLSPIPDDSTLNEEQLRRQRSRWRRVLRTALPLQALLVLLMGAACLVPHCDDEYCCQLLNNFAKSFDPSLEFVNGPPPF
ncbi:Protein CBG23936 [Caenorhabditis briggsae]|uniref:Protein CBG23936 n=1 Tax=Caenorhabditis briggsae TaxID=6238 RepID=H8WGZ4_CAEBR|nr:Protein CBG23936 [Caenorhabditis briggsae]CCG58617.1 Protein CBG23936 [Caenorhabditis briggsae]